MVLSVNLCNFVEKVFFSKSGASTNIDLARIPLSKIKLDLVLTILVGLLTSNLNRIRIFKLPSVLLKFSYWLIDRLRLAVRKILPTEMWLEIKSLLPLQTINIAMGKIHIKEWQDARRKSPQHSVSRELKEGINLVGYFRAVKGIGEAAHSSAVALETAKIPYTINDYEFGVPVWQQIGVLPKSKYGTGFKFNANLIHVNPPQLPFLWNRYRREELATRYNIGVWYWELPDLPEEWQPAFGLVDEVWAATQFILDSISANAHIPVVKIPPCIHPIYDERLNRSDFNLPSDRFLFMCAYDVLSIQARKNPLGAVDAFKHAFPKNDSAVGLVIKVNNAAENPHEMRQLRNSIKGYSNCYIVMDVLDKPRFNSLLNVTNAYISLHRSEGFGLIPAEAMSLGKPVIMTRWSGNLDFMTPDNSCGVDYKLVLVNKRIGPYTAGQCWADPSIDHASFFMQKLVTDQKYYTSLSEQAKKTIQENYSPQQIGQKIKERMISVGLI